MRGAYLQDGISSRDVDEPGTGGPYYDLKLKKALHGLIAFQGQLICQDFFDVRQCVSGSVYQQAGRDIKISVGVDRDLLMAGDTQCQNEGEIHSRQEECHGRQSKSVQPTCPDGMVSLVMDL